MKSVRVRELIRLLLCVTFPVIMELMVGWLIFPESEETSFYKIYYALLVGGALFFVTGFFEEKISI